MADIDWERVINIVVALSLLVSWLTHGIGRPTGTLCLGLAWLILRDD
jgi:hypothetical protein